MKTIFEKLLGDAIDSGELGFSKTSHFYLAHSARTELKAIKVIRKFKSLSEVIMFLSDIYYNIIGIDERLYYELALLYLLRKDLRKNLKEKKIDKKNLMKVNGMIGAISAEINRIDKQTLNVDSISDTDETYWTNMVRERLLMAEYDVNSLEVARGMQRLSKQNREERVQSRDLTINLLQVEPEVKPKVKSRVKSRVKPKAEPAREEPPELGHKMRIKRKLKSEPEPDEVIYVPPPLTANEEELENALEEDERRRVSDMIECLKGGVGEDFVGNPTDEKEKRKTLPDDDDDFF